MPVILKVDILLSNIKHKSFQSRIVTVMLFIDMVVSLVLNSYSYTGVCSVNAESSLFLGNVDFPSSGISDH